MSRMRAATARPTGDEVLADLVELHTALPGITEATIGECRTAGGQTGYELLVAALPRDARDVLDLGCGNGPMLERLLSRTPALERVVGVDACGSELEVARRRLSDPRLELRHERGQDLSLESASMDAVLSHHAFYLMEPVEPVVAHLARVLRPGGVFAFVTSSRTPEAHPVYQALMESFSPLTRRDNPHVQGWGDRRVWSETGLAELFFTPAAGFTPELSIEEHALELHEPPFALCGRLMSFFYSAFLQRPETRAELRRRWLEILAATCTPDGLAHATYPFGIVRLRKARAAELD